MRRCQLVELLRGEISWRSYSGREFHWFMWTREMGGLYHFLGIRVPDPQDSSVDNEPTY